MDAEIDALRSTLEKQGDASHSTPKFQDDLLRTVAEAAPYGNCVIEVGCHHGGMSAQLALVTRRLGLALHVLDIDPTYLAHARHVTASLVGEGVGTFTLSDFPTFAASAPRTLMPALIFIDGDHRYDGVMADIRALYAMRTLTHLAAFHDYSLRYAAPDQAHVRVDRAVQDAFGADFSHRGIGTLARPGGPLRTEPEEDGHFHEAGAYEGVVIECTTAPRPRLA